MFFRYQQVINFSAVNKDAHFYLKGRPYTCACMNGFIVNLENENYCVSDSAADGGKYLLFVLFFISVSFDYFHVF